MIRMPLVEVAAAVGGELRGATGAEQVTGSVEFDSRTVTPGGLFLALPGQRVDGHDYVAAARAAGAVAALVTRRPERAGTPTVLVADGTAALGRLAGHVVRRLPGLDVVGLTGSSGKTSTKDLLAGVLGPHAPTVAPPGSFNNELGHPWTVLRADERTRYLVLELSARGTGHIAAQCAVAPPRVGVVLNVGRAHLGEFGSPEAVAAAKGELVGARPPAERGGVAVLNADDDRVAAMAARTPARVVTFGRGRDADVGAADVAVDVAGRARFRLITRSGEADVSLRLVGEHQVGNALAAAAAAAELGVPLEAVAAGLSAAEPASPWRMAVTERPDGVTVVNDAYNANPESMRAALQALSAISAGARRGWAVLGPMAELGPGSDAAHAEVGALAERLRVHRLVAVGTERYGARATVVPDVSEAVRLLRDEVRPDDVVLVKASRAERLERIAAALTEAPG